MTQKKDLRGGPFIPSITGSLYKSKNPPEAGSLNFGARTRTKMPGAFLHRAASRDPEGEPQDVASVSNLR